MTCAFDMAANAMNFRKMYSFCADGEKGTDRDLTFFNIRPINYHIIRCAHFNKEAPSKFLKFMLTESLH